jgi:hypothetical protein
MQVCRIQILDFCLDIPRRFCLISSESAVEGFGSGSLAMNEVCGSGSEAEKVIGNSSYLGEDVLNSKLVMSIISF